MNILFSSFFRGSGRLAYKLRAEIAWETFARNNLKANLLSVNCNVTISDVALRFLTLIPGLHDNSVCSSPYCPIKQEHKTFPLLRTNNNVLQRSGITELQEAVLNAFGEQNSDCRKIICARDRLSGDIPAYFLIDDMSISKTNILCNGRRIHNISTGNSILIEVNKVMLN